MTHTEIGSHVAITTVPIVSESYDIAVDLARDYLQGCTRDYLFFWHGSGFLSPTSSYQDYVLLICDDLTHGANYAAFGVDVIHIYVVKNTVSSSTSFSFSGNTIDLDTSPISSFSGSGSSSDYYFEYQTAGFAYHRDTVEVESVVDNVIYSSLDLHPHLIEGVQNYAFSAFVFAVAIIAFKLCDRIFRRVY